MFMLAYFAHWRKNIYSAYTEKPNESPVVRKCSNQEERRRDETPSQTIKVHTVTDGISRRVTSRA